MKRGLFCILFFWLIQPMSATPVEIPVINFSGEIHTIGPEDNSRQSVSDPGVPGWDGGGQIISDGQTAAGNGECRISLEDSTLVFNRTDHVIRAGNIYTLTFDSSTFLNLPVSVTAQLYADDGSGVRKVIAAQTFTFSVLQINHWESFEHHFTVPADADYTGAYLGVQFTGPNQGDSTYLSVDVVRMFYDTIGGLNYSIPSESLILDERTTSSEQVQLSLRTQPQSEVFIFLTPASNDITLEGAGPDGHIERIFTPSNWSTGQSIRIKSVDDTVSEGMESAGIRAIITSDDPMYNGLTSADYLVWIRDDDRAGFTLSRMENLVVAEGSATQANYTLVLDKMPAGELKVNIENDSIPQQVMVSPVILLFDYDNWFIPQTISLTAIDDLLAEEANHTTRLRHTFETNDSEYLALPPFFVDVTILENDCGAWGYFTGDINHDCIVNIADFARLVNDWLTCSQPGIEGCISFNN